MKIIFCFSFITWKVKTSVSFLGINNWDVIAVVFVLLFNIFGSFVLLIFTFMETSLYWNTEKAKWRKVRERECFDWNLFLSSAAHYCIITRCSLFWKLEIVSWLFFLLLDNLSENNLVSKNKDLLKKIIDKKLTWKLERFGKCIKTSIYLGIILPRA